FVPLFILATAYAFARFAFSLYAPAPRPSGLAWRLSSRDGAAGGWPYLQLIACILCAWALWRAWLYGHAPELLPFCLYWSGFALWGAAGAALGAADCRIQSRADTA
ncbi:MAG: hypothetical protein JO276_08815, partial [Sphingomonadaceae bacterium]|nr:hypothetical protein [Sphingomonadaceae bacterium]